MTIDTQLYLITGGLTLSSTFAAYQSWRLRTYYRSASALFGSLVFLALGARYVYSLMRLKSLIADARVRGVMIDHLTTEQWLTTVVWTYAIMIGFNCWLHWRRRDLKELGL